MKTPWQAFPEYKRHSMGWRMGDADGYLHKWRAWFQSLSEQDQIKFIQDNPRPEEWMGFYNILREQPLSPINNDKSPQNATDCVSGPSKI